MLLSEGQMSDYKGAALMIDALPRAKALLADRGYDADWFRAALTERGITPCIPSKVIQCDSLNEATQTVAVVRGMRHSSAGLNLRS